jgi:hypothetical protein
MPGDKQPFPAGKSANPGGRPRVPPEVKALLRERGPDAIKKQLALMDSPDERIALAASVEIANRAYGKAMQPLMGEDGEPISIALNFDRMTDDQLQAFIALGRVALADGDPEGIRASGGGGGDGTTPPDEGMAPRSTP